MSMPSVMQKATAASFVKAHAEARTVTALIDQGAKPAVETVEMTANHGTAEIWWKPGQATVTHGADAPRWCVKGAGVTLVTGDQDGKEGVGCQAVSGRSGAGEGVLMQLLLAQVN